MHKDVRQKIKGRGAVGKTIVAGMLQREGAVVAQVIPHADADTLLPLHQGKSIAKHDDLHR
jgi:hypothetical protein